MILKLQVKKSIYFLYLKYIGVGFGVAFVALLAISEVFNAAAHVWLSIWTSDSSSADEGTSDSKLNMRLIVYSTLGLCYGKW